MARKTEKQDAKILKEKIKQQIPLTAFETVLTELRKEIEDIDKEKLQKEVDKVDFTT
jgi:hypothetical protein